MHFETVAPVDRNNFASLPKAASFTKSLNIERHGTAAAVERAASPHIFHHRYGVYCLQLLSAFFQFNEQTVMATIIVIKYIKLQHTTVNCIRKLKKIVDCGSAGVV